MGGLSLSFKGGDTMEMLYITLGIIFLTVLLEIIKNIKK